MNAVNIIFPYRHNGFWVFDDPTVSLNREPFVGGADTIIDLLTSHIPDAGEGFSLIFSAAEFPGAQHRITWIRQDMGGNIYRADGIDVEGWLCPALFLYFDSAPKEIFVKIDSLS